MLFSDVEELRYVYVLFIYLFIHTFIFINYVYLM